MRTRKTSLRHEGRLVEALLIFFKQVTAHARWVFLILLILYACSGILAIAPQETALVRRLGNLQKTLHGPGLLISLPKPFDEVLRFESAKENAIPMDRWASAGSKIADPDIPLVPTAEQAKQQVLDRGTVGDSIYSAWADKEGTMLDPLRTGYTITSDFNVIQGRFLLRYRIDDPFLFTAAGDNIENLLSKLAYRSLSRELAGRPIDASLTQDRKPIAEGVVEQVQSEADRLKLGIKVSGFEIRELAPPTQVIAAFEEVNNARQFAKTIFENSREYHAQTVAQSEGEAASIRHRASGYIAGQIGAARGEADAFESLLANYERQPALVGRRLLRESLDVAFGAMNSRTLIPPGGTRPVLILEPSPEFGR